MYRPSMYNKHDESMYAFAELFNNCKVCNDVIMKPNDEETYGNDGYFIHSNGQKIGYDSVIIQIRMMIRMEIGVRVIPVPRAGEQRLALESKTHIPIVSITHHPEDIGHFLKLH